MLSPFLLARCFQVFCQTNPKSVINKMKIHYVMVKICVIICAYERQIYYSEGHSLMDGTAVAQSPAVEITS